MAKGIWRKEGEGAVPVGAASIEFFKKIKDGAEFTAETKVPRNIKLLRLWWALCDLVVIAGYNSEFWRHRDDVSDGLKYAIKLVDHFWDDTGKLHIKPRSIAMESELTQEEFDRYFDHAVDVILAWLGSAPKDMSDRFFEMTADKRYADKIRSIESRYGKP